MLSSITNSWTAWSGGVKSNKVKVTNTHMFDVLKVRVDCNRYKTEYTFSSEVRGIQISKEYRISMNYVVDTSTSFVLIAPGGSQSFVVDGEYCYMSAYMYDGVFNIPLFINHQMPACPEIFIGYVPYIEDKEVLKKYIDKAVIVKNNLPYDIEARVDCDEGVVSVVNTIDFKVMKAKLTMEDIVYYKAEKQGYTKIPEGKKAIFYVNSPNDSCFVSIDMYPEGWFFRDKVITLWKNIRAKMTATLKGKVEEEGSNKILGVEYYPISEFYGINRLGPKFNVQKDEKEGVKVRKEWFMYERMERPYALNALINTSNYKTEIITSGWQYWDDDDEDIVYDFNPTKLKVMDSAFKALSYLVKQ